MTKPEQAVARLMSQLVGELQDATERWGVESVIDVCKEAYEAAHEKAKNAEDGREWLTMTLTALGAVTWLQQIEAALDIIEEEENDGQQ